MDARTLRKCILGHLASLLVNEVLIDRLEDDDHDRCWAEQLKLAEEFKRRSEGGALSDKYS